MSTQEIPLPNTLRQLTKLTPTKIQKLEAYINAIQPILIEWRATYTSPPLEKIGHFYLGDFDLGTLSTDFVDDMLSTFTICLLIPQVG